MRQGKTLLPELLPDPRPQSDRGPRERVTVRARAMLDRLSGLKTAAGTALLAVHCTSYGVVDPLPPPPVQCTSNADPFTNLSVTGITVAADGGDSNAVIVLTNYSAVGYEVDAVRVTAGGTLVGVEDKSQTSADPGTDFWITIRPDGSGEPVKFEVDLGCGVAMTTKHYLASPISDGYSVVELG